MTGRGRSREILGERGHRRRRPGRRRRLEDVCATARRSRRRPSWSTSCASWSGRAALVENADDLLIDPADGLRIINEVDQLAAFEYAACQTSDGVRRLLLGLRPGMTEREAVRLLGWNGTPLSCHLMLTAGPRATLGLLSPSDRPHRAGRPVHGRVRHLGRADLPGRASSSRTPPSCPRGIADYVERLVAPYFEAVAEWYEALHIGLTGGTLQAIIDRRLGDPFFGIFLNPGHQLHLDEWVNSPVCPGSTIELRSGMAFQVDIIPATGTDYFTTNIEDGLALADEASARRDRGALSRRPGRASRRAARSCADVARHRRSTRTCCRFSNIPAYLPPFLLRPDRVMTLA